MYFELKKLQKENVLDKLIEANLVKKCVLDYMKIYEVYNDLRDRGYLNRDAAITTGNMLGKSESRVYAIIKLMKIK